MEVVMDNLNFFVNGRYVGCEVFSGTKKQAAERAAHLFAGHYYTLISLESKGGKILAVFNA
jgi:hypothetical protein